MSTGAGAGAGAGAAGAAARTFTDTSNESICRRSPCLSADGSPFTSGTPLSSMPLVLRSSMK